MNELRHASERSRDGHRDLLAAFAGRLRAALLLLAISGSAHATYHLWHITQIYSNADATVQYIELTAYSSGQEFIAGHTITSSQGATTHSYTFPANLPGNTATTTSGGYGGTSTNYKSFLIGTQGFAALGVVAPDYVVPNGFLFTANGTVNYAEGVEVLSYASLPTDGSHALNRGGTTGINSPTNFDGDNATLTAAVLPHNFQGLWWRSPAGSESGWGVNLTHQGDILFATWFTYDADGSGMWLVMSNGNKTAANTYSGALYRTTGPAFSAVPFDPAMIGVTPVGTATFSFSDADNGTFTYTVNGVTQSKPITRQIFSAPVPVCVAGGTPGATTNFQDLWWRSPAGSESGWGVNITHQGDILFATWFTYEASGKGMWLVMSNGNKTAANTYSGTLYRTTGPAFNAVPFDPTMIGVTPVGTGTFTFSDSSNGVFGYTVNGVTQSKAITRQVYSSPATVCN